MPYVTSLVLLGVGLLLLLLLLLNVYRVLGRFRAAQKEVAGDLDDRGGMVKARVAGIRVAIDERRR